MNSQNLKLKQQQKLTPQQILLQRLLQVPVTQLEQAIKEEMEHNPLLEESTPDETPDELPLPEEEPADNEGDVATDEYMMPEEIDPETADLYDDDDYAYRERQEHDPNQEERQTIVADGTSFLDYLQNQLNMKELSPQQQIIAQEIIGCLDDSGYLGRDINLIVNDLAFRQNLDISTQEAEEVLRAIQSLDPPGVGARSLQECLSLQLHRMAPTTLPHKVAEEIVDHHFADFSNKRYTKITESLGIDEDTLTQAIQYIKTLNPKPGSLYTEDSGTAAHPIMPDFYVTRQGQTLSFSLNGAHTPTLQVSPYYAEMLTDMAQQKHPSAEEKETIQFLKEKKTSAETFIQTLNQRQQTLSHTMQAILQLQHDYFLTGNKALLKPLRLKDIAAITALDESTISRVVNQKYVQTEFGTFLLKEVFSSAMNNDEGQSVSADSIRHHLHEAILHEDKAHPLTDEQLTQLLNDMGYPLARRTVSKYREQLGLPVWRLRKEL